jgi:uncharacterized protein (TIGR03437 family)
MKHLINQARIWLKIHSGPVIAMAGIATIIAFSICSAIRLAPAVSADDNINLNCDQPVSGSIDPGTETDTLSFTAMDGDRVEFTIVKTSPSGGNFQPFWRLVRNDGTPAFPCGSFVLSSQGECGPLSSNFSPYRIEVQDFNHNDTGTYRAHLYRLPANTACENTQLACNLPLQGVTEDPLDSDFFSINDVVNEFVRVNVTRGANSGANYQPSWRLVQGNGSPAGLCGFFVTTSQVTCGPLPPEGNPYRIEVQDFNRDNTGNYTLAVNFLIGACPTTTISLSPNPINVVAGASENVIVTIDPSRNAPTTVTLQSSNPAIASAPNSVTIPAGSASAAFALRGAAAGGPVTITAMLPAELGGGKATTTVTVNQPLTAAQIEVNPPNPTTADDISIRISGAWPNSCIPLNPQVTRVGNEIRIATSNPGQICLTVLTGWSHTLRIGQLGTGAFEVIVTHTAPNSVMEIGRRRFEVTSPPFITRIIRAVNTNANPSSQVTVPITLDAQGNENAVGFSMGFDPSILSNPQVALGSDAENALVTVNANQVAQGRLGVLMALPAGQRFNQGVRQLLRVTFAVAATQATSTAISPVDQPIVCQASDVNAGPLEVSCVSGVVTIFQGLEGDVAPRPSGNGAVTIADCVQVGRFIASLDVPSTGPGGEFQRADTAPRNTRGDGRFTISDWVQTCRYAAALDPAQPVGGPASLVAATGAAVAATGPPDPNAEARALRIVSGSSGRAFNELVVALDALGNEAAVGFSLVFDPTAWRFDSASAGADAGGGTINVNADQSRYGRVGIALSLPAGSAFAVGTRELVRIRFTPVSAGTEAPMAAAFGDLPVGREAADAGANALQIRYASNTPELGRAAIVSAASFNESPLAAGSIATAFDVEMAATASAASAQPLPLELAGTSVVVRDAAGVDRPARIFFASPAQVNFLMPEGLAIGPATVVIRSANGRVAAGSTEISPVSPAMFTANSSGDGPATALALRIKADGARSYEPVAVFDPAQNRFTAAPIDLGEEDDQVFLVMFGSGIRHRSSLAGVSANIGGADAEVVYAGAQGEMAGLDQINIRIPRSLAGKGDVKIAVKVEGAAANAVQIKIR